MRDLVRLRIALEGIEPPIWRRVDVPANIWLKELHSVIQAAMGWQTSLPVPGRPTEDHRTWPG
jgi:Plasmid pRiA4b ORF-3-like protein